MVLKESEVVTVELIVVPEMLIPVPEVRLIGPV